MKSLQIVLLLVLPIAWGLLVEFVFERLRRRRNGRRSRAADSSAPPSGSAPGAPHSLSEPSPHDWVI